MTDRVWVTDLPLGTIDRERAAIFVAEFLDWWAAAGRLYHGPLFFGGDEGLQHMAADAIEIAGGLTSAQIIAPALNQEDTMDEQKKEHDAGPTPPSTPDPPPTNPSPNPSSPQGDGDSRETKSNQ